MDEAHRRQGGGHSDRNQQSHEPGCQCQPSGPLTEQPELEFVACQEEEEPETDVGYQLKAGRVSPPQHLRSDQNPPDDEDHRLRHAQPGEESRHDGGQRGDHG